MPDKRPLKVTFLSHSDLNGGAAIVTTRLIRALRNSGVDARMVVFTKYGDSPYVDVISTRYRRTVTFALERAHIYYHNGLNRDDLFRVSDACLGMDIMSHPWVRDADIVNLSWVNQGLLSLRGLSKLLRSGKPVVWTMHDMWAMTGICHHAGECQGYLYECGSCPLLHGKAHPGDLSRRVWERKKEVYAQGKIEYVAVSNWLAERARESTLLADKPLHVIPNAFPVDTFFTEPLADGSTSFDPIPGRKRIIFGAARLDDPIKGLDMAIQALNRIFDNDSTLSNRMGVMFFGEMRRPDIFDTLRFPYLYLGTIRDQKLLRQVYASSDIVLSTSQYETLPGTLIEGQAAGCVPVTFDRGGQADIVDHLNNGYLARYGDIDDLVEGIRWALEAPVTRQMLHDNVVQRFSAPVVADRYIRLYRAMLQNR